MDDVCGEVDAGEDVQDIVELLESHDQHVTHENTDLYVSDNCEDDEEEEEEDDLV